MKRSKSLHSNDRNRYSAFSKVERTSVYSRAPDINSDNSIHGHSNKETAAEKARRRRAWLKAVHRRNIFSAAKNFLKELPYLIWKRYIVALLIPRYRPEWGRYNKWEPLTPNERKIKEKKKSVDRSVAAASVQNSKSKKRSNAKKKQKHATDLPPKPVNHDHTNCIPVRINISGQIFEPQLRTLKQFPDTLLGNPKRMIQYYDPSRDEFFFDRHRSSFEAILYYYNTGGILRRPPGVDAELFLEEVKFFDLGKDVILGLQNIDVTAEEDRPLPRNLLKRKIWLLFEYPESSYQSRILAFISVLAVCISILEFCIETLPDFELEPIELRETLGHKSHSHKGELSFADPFFFAETLCIIFFVFEYLIRALTCPNFFDFAKEISNVIDLVAILPYFLNLLYSLDEQQAKNGEPVKESKAVSLTVLRIIRLVRVFRILKLSRHNRGLKVLGKTLKSSIRELGLLMFFLMVGVMVFSSVIFFAEAQYENTPFKSIPTGFWFGIVTMTTLGYGDIVPVGPWGRIIGALCAITGVLTISLPVPVIVSNFNMFYNSAEVHKSSTADSRKRPECNYVEQCPYYPALYSHDGEVIGDTMESSKRKKDKSNDESNSAQWLRGEQKQDLSDSDFDPLLKDETLRKHVLPKPKVRASMVIPKKSIKTAPVANPQKAVGRGTGRGRGRGRR